MATLNEIDGKTKLFADARTRLADQVRMLNDAVETAKRKHMPLIKEHLGRCAQHSSDLQALIAASPELFVKPRSQVLHGVKVGFQKMPGVIAWASLDALVKRVRAHFPKQFDVLIKTTYKPVKKALQQLPATDLKKIGCTVSADSDEVLIKDTNSDVDKLVDALLKEATEEAEA